MQRLVTCSKHLGQLLVAKHLTIATAESCTAGRISAAITCVDGASAYFVGGVVSYAVTLKQEMLHVSAETIRHFGVVSQETTLAMNEGVRRLTHADMAVSITGYAGASGSDEFAKNGTIWIAVALNGFQPKTRCIHVNETREINLQEATFQALKLAISYLESL